MQPEQGLIRRATPDDAAALAQLASRTFEETFGAGNDPADLVAHLASSYSEAQQRAEILDPEMATLLFEQNGVFGGYAQVRRHPPPPEVPGRNPIQLERLYVDAAHHGRGVGQQLMRAVHAVAHEMGGDTIWLTVWTENPRAIAFYRKCGFDVVGSTIFVVGSDPQTDHLMAAPVEAAP